MENKRKSQITNSAIVDIETANGCLILVGVCFQNKYYYFKDGISFFEFINNAKIKQIFAHNLEFDFFKLWESVRKEKTIKFNAYYSANHLSYIQQGNIFWKDVFNHLPYSLALLGKILKYEKMKIDYENIDKLPFEKLLEYNERDCLITNMLVEKLMDIYTKEGSKKIKSTSGAQAMDIYIRRFYGLNFNKLPEKHIQIWRKGYHGGIVEAYEIGKFKGVFYKIDVNSLFPFVMLESYPYPYNYKIVKNLSTEERLNFHWLGVKYKNNDVIKVINSEENKNEKADEYFIFTKECYPFYDYVQYFYQKKKVSTGIEREIYKRLLNSLYGKFGQKNEIDILTTNNKIIKKDKIFYYEEIFEDLFRIKMETNNKFWANVVWSLFTTAKARKYMRDIEEMIFSRGLKVYYIDTDCFIIEGDIDSIKEIIDNEEIGFFKIEGMSNILEIKGKKFYRFGDEYKVKGVPKEYQQMFFENDKIIFKRMVRFKESLRTGETFGAVIEDSKSNVLNKDDDEKIKLLD